MAGSSMLLFGVEPGHNRKYWHTLGFSEREVEEQRRLQSRQPSFMTPPRAATSPRVGPSSPGRPGSRPFTSTPTQPRRPIPPDAAFRSSFTSPPTKHVAPRRYFFLSPTEKTPPTRVFTPSQKQLEAATQEEEVKHDLASLGADSMATVELLERPAPAEGDFPSYFPQGKQDDDHADVEDPLVIPEKWAWHPTTFESARTMAYCHRIATTEKIEFPYRLTSAAAGRVAEALATVVPQRRIEVMDVRYNRLESPQLNSLLSVAALKNGSLIRLELSGNKCSTPVAATLSAYLSWEGCRLERLELQLAEIDNVGALAASLAHNRSLKSLNLRENLLAQFLTSAPKISLRRKSVVVKEVQNDPKKLRAQFTQKNLLEGLSPLLVQCKYLVALRSSLRDVTAFSTSELSADEDEFAQSLSVTGAVKKVYHLIAEKAALLGTPEAEDSGSLAEWVANSHVCSHTGRSRYQNDNYVVAKPPATRRRQREVVTLYRVAGDFQVYPQDSRKELTTPQRRTWQILEVLGLEERRARLYTPQIAELYVSVLNRLLLRAKGDAIVEKLGADEIFDDSHELKTVAVSATAALASITGPPPVDEDLPGTWDDSSDFLRSVANNEELDDLVVSVRNLADRKKHHNQAVDLDDLLETLLNFAFEASARIVHETRAALCLYFKKKRADVATLKWAEFEKVLDDVFFFHSLPNDPTLTQRQLVEVFREGVLGKSLHAEPDSASEAQYNKHHSAEVQDDLGDEDARLDRLVMALWRAGVYKRVPPSQSRPSRTATTRHRQPQYFDESESDEEQEQEQEQEVAPVKLSMASMAVLQSKVVTGRLFSYKRFAIAQTIQAKGALHISELDLSWNKLIGGREASLVIAHAPLLRCFKLAQNFKLGDEGAVAIASTLDMARSRQQPGQQVKLEHLDLSACGIRGRGALALAESVYFRLISKTLDCSANPLGALGLRALMRAVAVDAAPVRLELEGCSQEEHDDFAGSLTDPEVFLATQEWTLNLTDFEQLAAARRALRLVGARNGRLLGTLDWRAAPTETEAPSWEPVILSRPSTVTSRGGLTLTKTPPGKKASDIWEPPRDGELRLSLICETALPTATCTERGLSNLCLLLSQQDNLRGLFELAAKDVYLDSAQAFELMSVGLGHTAKQTDQAHAVFTQLRDHHDLGGLGQQDAFGEFSKTSIVERLIVAVLPRLIDRGNAAALTSTFLDGPQTARLLAKPELLGCASRPMLGSPNGKYCLKLGRAMDRLALRTLLELEETEAFDLSMRRRHCFHKYGVCAIRNVRLELSEGAVQRTVGGPLDRSETRAMLISCLDRCEQRKAAAKAPDDVKQKGGHLVEVVVVPGCETVHLDYASTRRPRLKQGAASAETVVELAKRCGFYQSHADVAECYLRDPRCLVRHNNAPTVVGRRPCPSWWRPEGKAALLIQQKIRIYLAYGAMMDLKRQDAWANNPHNSTADLAAPRVEEKKSPKRKKKHAFTEEEEEPEEDELGFYEPNGVLCWRKPQPSTELQERFRAAHGVVTADVPSTPHGGKSKSRSKSPKKKKKGKKKKEVEEEVEEEEEEKPDKKSKKKKGRSKSPKKKKKKKGGKPERGRRFESRREEPYYETQYQQSSEASLEELRLLLGSRCLDLSALSFLLVLYAGRTDESLRAVDERRAADLVVALLPSIIDMEGLLDALPARATRQIVVRLGVLATLSPPSLTSGCSFGRSARVRLDLSDRQSRALLVTLATLARAEKGSFVDCYKTAEDIELMEDASDWLLRGKVDADGIAVFPDEELKGEFCFSSYVPEEPNQELRAAIRRHVFLAGALRTLLPLEQRELMRQVETSPHLIVPLEEPAPVLPRYLGAAASEHLAAVFPKENSLLIGLVLQRRYHAYASRASRVSNLRRVSQITAVRWQGNVKRKLSRRASLAGEDPYRFCAFPSALRARLLKLRATLTEDGRSKRNITKPVEGSLQNLDLESARRALESRDPRFLEAGAECLELILESKCTSDESTAEKHLSLLELVGCYHALHESAPLNKLSFDVFLSALVDDEDEPVMVGSTKVITQRNMKSSSTFDDESQDDYSNGSVSTSAEKPRLHRRLSSTGSLMGQPPVVLQKSERLWLLEALGSRRRRVEQCLAVLGLSPKRRASLHAPIIPALYVQCMRRLGGPRVQKVRSDQMTAALTGADIVDLSDPMCVSPYDPATWDASQLLEIGTDGALLGLLQSLNSLATWDNNDKMVYVDDVLDEILDFTFQRAHVIRERIRVNMSKLRYCTKSCDLTDLSNLLKDHGFSRPDREAAKLYDDCLSREVNSTGAKRLDPQKCANQFWSVGLFDHALHTRAPTLERFKNKKKLESRRPTTSQSTAPSKNNSPQRAGITTSLSTRLFADDGDLA